MGQQLARAVAEGTAIRADTGTESTEWVKKERFSGKTPTLPWNFNATAVEAEQHSDGPGEVSFWKDESRLDSGKAEGKVAWRHQQAWKTQRVYMSTNKEVFDAEP